MLAIFVCHCANSELKARKVLRSAGISNYLSVRCHIGKKSCQVGMDLMPEVVKQSAEWGGMLEKINTSPSYSIIAGWDDEKMRWSDVYDGRIESTVPGEQISEYFA